MNVSRALIASAIAALALAGCGSLAATTGTSAAAPPSAAPSAPALASSQPCTTKGVANVLLKSDQVTWSPTDIISYGS